MKTVNYEIVYKLDDVESWLYFHSEEGKAKAAGEKYFKRVMKDSGYGKRLSDNFWEGEKKTTIK